MKKTLFFWSLLLLVFAAQSASAQVINAESELLGTWETEQAVGEGDEDAVRISLTLKEDGAASLGLLHYDEDIEGMLIISCDGAWAFDEELIFVQPDAKTMTMKYVGENKEMTEFFSSLTGELLDAMREQLGGEVTNIVLRLTELTADHFNAVSLDEEGNVEHDGQVLTFKKK